MGGRRKITAVSPLPAAGASGLLDTLKALSGAPSQEDVAMHDDGRTRPGKLCGYAANRMRSSGANRGTIRALTT